ncbi:MAG: GntR family transcriptional regulator, partial [Deltaproteobacteria bacterium]|nr:GntR family transcriptional regulator [Deltaproteobacteria bacterium]
TRLPAERELARQIGASRPTLREALRRMSEWGLVEARRGSGVVVRDRRSWALEVLPSFLLHGKFGEDGPAMGRVVADMLELRRTFLASLMSQVAPRVDDEGVAEARATLDQAWASRDDIGTFAALDLRVFSVLFESAGMLPSLWLLNSIGRVYRELAPTLGQAIAPPDDYHASLTSFIDAVEAGDGELAVERLREYFTRTDERLAKLLQALGA